MVKRSYFYLGEQKIEIDAPNKLLKRVNRNFEEIPTNDNFNVGVVKISEGEYIKLKRDRSKPYLVTRKNTLHDYPGIDFLRYGLCVRTIWEKNPLNYEVKNFMPLDETGVLSCFKKIYYNTPSSKDKVLIQGSLIDIMGEGILIVGECWSGKTSLAMGFLEKTGGRLVSDGNTLISYNDKITIGHYLPRPIFVRFHSINKSERLSQLLTNLQDTESIQPFDREAIEEVITKKRYHLDAGLNISRKRFAESIGIQTIPISKINRIIHTEFRGLSLPKIGFLSKEESYKLLLRREFPKSTTLGNIKHQREIKRPKESILKSSWVENLKRLKISFDAKRNLTKTLLEDLICSH